MSYAELFCQSNFSFLQGASHPEELVRQAHFLRYRAIAITDECSIAGVVRAHTAIKREKLNIQLIIGSLFKLSPGLQLVLLCPNHAAYAELCRVITNARRRSPKGQYELSKWDLKTCKQCLAIWIPTGHKQQDQQWGTWLNKYYRNRLWIGCQRHLSNGEQDYLQHCQALSDALAIPITACGGVLLHNPDRLALQHVLAAIRNGTPVAKNGQAGLCNSERSLRSLNKLWHLYPTPWLTAAQDIASRCHFSLETIPQIYAYPAELVPAGKTPGTYLRELVLKGLTKRFSNPPVNYFHIKRTIVKELRLIEKMQYEYFFLTIHDIVQFAQQQNILYQGRGSAANSVVCYCLEITAVDPRQIDVLFERFISEERAEPPDIDVDFEHHRREEVIQYIYQKYGRERTALAATVVTYRFKSALREVGKALGINESQLEFFIKNVNRRDKALGWQAQLHELGLNSSSGVGQQLSQLVTDIMGFPRHLSQHVGGFVISAPPLYQVVAVENAAMPERTIIQWDKDDLESLGLLKVDILALGMLTAIRKCFDLIARHYHKQITLADITAMPADPRVYEMIQKADTVGVFQIESRAQMSMLPRLRPACYYDLVIQIAIVRPGPIQGEMVHPFLLRRSGKQKPEYPSEAVKAVLSRTQGVPIFQEQVIKLAMVAAGFSGGEADQLRRAMANWNKNGELLTFKTRLIQGMLSRGYQVEFAERIFKQICGFGEYGFPESHSASFAVLVYASAWLKYHFPPVFYTALLNSWPMGFYSPAQLIADAKRHNIQFLPVCVNQSDYQYRLQESDGATAIRVGLKQVKGLSQKFAEALINNRPKTGYRHISEVKQLAAAKNELSALASGNALHSLLSNRYQARWSLLDSEHELPLFANNQTTPDTPLKADPTPLANLLEDYAATGLSLNQHPISLLKQQLGNFTPAKLLHTVAHKSLVSVVGLVVARQAPGTASGVTFMTLEDHTGNINVIIWLATARAQKQAFLKSKIVKIKGLLERGDGDVTHIIAGKIINLTHLLSDIRIKGRDFH